MVYYIEKFDSIYIFQFNKNDDFIDSSGTWKNKDNILFAHVCESPQIHTEPHMGLNRIELTNKKI